MSARVEFIEVGRERRSWVADTSNVPADDMDADGAPSCDWLAREAKRRGGLASSVVDVAQMGDDPTELHVIVGGWRPVGRVKIGGQS